MNSKPLVKKFAYTEFMKEKEKQGWILPTKADLEELDDIPYDLVWVNDMPPCVDDILTHAMVYSVSTGKLLLTNKSHMHHVIVLYQKELCPHCWGKL